MRIVDIRELTVPISRYLDPSIPSGGLNTSIVAVTTDQWSGGRPVVGYGFASIGRFAQGGLIRERFAPRLLQATEADLMDDDERNIDPFKAWNVMMAGEKPGGHGERCVAVGTLDIALWDAAAKIADLPLYQLLAERLDSTALLNRRVQVYAGGGYYYPSDDLSRLSDEIVRFMDLGFLRAKIKIGARALPDDLARIEAASRLLGGGENLAVDAMNAYDPVGSRRAADAISSYGLWWFEDICDPLDFETLASVAAGYGRSLAAGEALFSAAEAALLDRHAGLRRDRDILVFDPVHCYGLPGYFAILRLLQDRGWPRSSFWPHGGHLFCLHLVAALGLGGAESNPLAFLPFGGLPNDLMVLEGIASPPETSGVGFERKDDLWKLMRTLQ